MLKSLSRSTFIYAILCVVILSTHYVYYPKWKKSSTEATLSWDVAGYYMYLPATFIYKDLKQCRFHTGLRNKYNFTPDFQQAFRHKASGNYVMKYSMGQAVQYAPFFFIANWYASVSPHHEADGFSIPYQFMISLGSIFIALLGLFYMTKCLKVYFDHTAVSLSLLCFVLGTNYLNYIAIDGAMTHNNLFTIYALIIFITIRFYQRPSYMKAITIGCLVGLAALTRPTEIISCLIPILWGLNIFNKKALKARVQFFLLHHNRLISAAISCILVGSLQLFYWHYITGDWVVYSYQEEGFSWLKPHLFNGLFSYRSGWLIYSPLMIFSLVGFWFLYKNWRDLYSPILIFFLLFIYIAFAWDIWWYGGSLGQRTMVQVYPILLFPFTAWIQSLLVFKRTYRYGLFLIMLLFIYLNLWFTHQAHRGGLLHAGMMTKAYYWKTLGTYTHDSNNLKLLDTDEYFDRQRTNIVSIEEIYSDPILLTDTVQYSEIFTHRPTSEREWVRVSAEVSIDIKEWDVWRMTQMIVSLRHHDDLIKQKFIRLQRHLNDNQTKRIFMDMKTPTASPVTEIQVYFWNANSTKTIKIEQVKLELYNEK
jgi:hypothetical protein